MAGLASQRNPGRAALGHAIRKLAMMHIFMAGDAGQLREVVDRDRGPSHGFVAFVAGHRCVAAGERESRFLVPGQRDVRRFERDARVALLATIAPRVGGKLAAVRVLVAVDAERKLHFVARLFPGRDMAGFAFDFAVRDDERKAGLGVIGNAECGWLEAFDCMATLAAAMVGAARELALVRVWLVAVRALRVRNRAFEVAIKMAGETWHVGMLPKERVVCFRVIESGLKR